MRCTFQNQKFLKPNGLEMLKKIIDKVKQFEEAYRIDDISALKSLYDAVNMCVSISKSIANNGSLNDLANSKRQIMVSLFKTTE